MKRATIALIGNPNTGKTTLFNALTGLKQRVGNYPGVTVERKVGEVTVDSTTIDLVDLPGTYSLAAQSPDEMIVVDLLLGQQAGAAPVDGILAIVDASNLQRNLYLISQLLAFRLPLVLVLNMVDVAHNKGIAIDTCMLSQHLGIPIVTTQANSGGGIEQVRRALLAMTQTDHARMATTPSFPEAVQRAIHQVEQELAERKEELGRTVSRVEAERILIDTQGYAATRIIAQCPTFGVRLTAIRQSIHSHGTLSGIEAAARYQWIRSLLAGTLTQPAQPRRTWTDRVDALLTHKIFGTAIFLAMTVVVFQSIYTWATPLMEMIDRLFGNAGSIIERWLPAGALRSLLVDGIIKGVGSVLMFLPQIAILFFFLALLEDCGYMARAAFLMDKLLARLGLSGKSFIPMLSSFACAIPGIMATRTIEHRRDRLATILVAPLMSCSARLPVYTIMIAAFVPAHSYLGGWVGLQGLMLFAMHLVGFVVAVPIVWLLKRTLLKGATPPFVMELPSYKRPSFTLVGYRVYDRSRAFVRRAGTIIVALTIVVWALAYFPHPAEIHQRYATENSARSFEQESGEYLRASIFGRLGHWMEPVVRPLGWDWRIGMAALASFPAREVIVAVLGTIYNLGDQVDETSTGLQTALRAATWPDGRVVFNLPVALSVMIFFALCCQCGATVATIRRETNSWGWAWFTFSYMTVLAYIGALVAYQGTMAIGWGQG